MRTYGRAFSMVVLIVSAFVLAIKVLVPTTIQIFIYGELTTLKQVPNIYTLLDIIVVAIFSCILGISASYLFFSESKSITEPESQIIPKPTVNISSDPGLISNVPNQNSIEVDIFLKALKGNDRKVMELLVELGELNQAELASRADIPKSTLSRTLADLEKRGVIIRYENGMSKMVKLADDFQK